MYPTKVVHSDAGKTRQVTAYAIIYLLLVQIPITRVRAKNQLNHNSIIPRNAEPRRSKVETTFCKLVDGPPIGGYITYSVYRRVGNVIYRGLLSQYNQLYDYPELHSSVKTSTWCTH